MFDFLKKKDSSLILSPVSGTVSPLCQCKDKAFADGMLGQGVIFNYDGKYVCAPCSGKVAVVANTNHSVALFCDNGAELLLHVGMDTVMLGGKGLKVLVKKGQRVRTGQRLISIDRELMTQKGIDLTTPMVVMNHDELELAIKTESGPVKKGKSEIMICKKTEED